MNRQYPMYAREPLGQSIIRYVIISLLVCIVAFILIKMILWGLTSISKQLGIGGEINILDLLI